MNSILLNAVSKEYRVRKVLKEITLNIEEGTIFGLLGPSGAGKTTLINILTNQLRATSGDVVVMGVQPQHFSAQHYQSMGVMSDNSGYYPDLTLWDNLNVFAQILKADQQYLIQLMKTVDIFHAKDSLAKHLSTGMKQRMLLVRALLHRPTLVFLDEPTSGVDPHTSTHIHELLLMLKEEGTTIFLTTHNMNEATRLCDRVAFLNQGMIIEQGTPFELAIKYHRNKQARVTFVNGQTEQYDYEVFNELIKDNIEISMIHSNEPTLEDIFIQLTGDQADE